MDVTCIEHEYSSNFFLFCSIPKCILAFLWIVGVLGNVLNLVVFSQRDMSRSAVNSMFWWLSLSDLSELIILLLYEFANGWCSSLDLSYLALFYIEQVHEYNLVLLWSINYLLMVNHTITIVLNTALALMRYSDLRVPFKNRNRWDKSSVNRVVQGIFILSVLLCSPILYGISMPADTYVFVPLLGQFTVDYDEYYPNHGRTYLSIQLLEMVLRTVLLLALIVACTM